MRKMSRDEARAFLAEGTRTGKVATVREDGRPHVAPIWFILEEDTVAFTTWHGTVKAGNLDNSPRAAMVVDLEEPPYAHVIVEGPVTISNDPDDLRDVATKAGGRYMGADRAEEFGRRNAVEGELVVRIEMERVIGRANMTD